MASDIESRLQSQIAQAEDLIRHLSITLNNALKLLEWAREFVPNPIEWDNMLDALHRDVEASKKLLMVLRGHSSKE